MPTTEDQKEYCSKNIYFFERLTVRLVNKFKILYINYQNLAGTTPSQYQRKLILPNKSYKLLF